MIGCPSAFSAALIYLNAEYMSIRGADWIHSEKWVDPLRPSGRVRSGCGIVIFRDDVKIGVWNAVLTDREGPATRGRSDMMVMG